MPKMLQKMIVSFVDYDLDRDIHYNIMSLRGDDASVKAAVDAVKAVNGYVPVAAIEYNDKWSVEDNLEHAFHITQIRLIIMALHMVIAR